MAGELSFDELVADIKADPDRIYGKEITPEQILELQKRLNPYAYIAKGAELGTKRAAAISCTNLRAEYLQRFALTSLVGFLFRVLDEWEVPAEARRWVTAAGGKRAKAEAAARLAAAPLTPDDLLLRAESLRELAQIAKEAAEEAATAAAGIDGASPAEAVLRADRALAKARGLQYSAAFELRKFGLEADERIDAMEAIAREHPEVAAILDSNPPIRRPVAGQIEMPATAAKGIISNFLRAWFEFNPDAHVRSAYDEFVIEKTTTLTDIEGLDRKGLVDSADPARLPLAAIRAAPEIATEAERAVVAALTVTRDAYNSAAYMLRNGQAALALLSALEAPEKFRRLLFPIAADSPVRPAVDIIPPQDTFHRWRYYTEVNYEELRTATEAIYHDKPDLDWALVLYETFAGTPEEVDAAFEDFRDKHQDEVISDIKGIDFGSWTLLGDFKENREKINIYNKHTDVLKRILDRHAEDKKLGQELMRKRIKVAKAENIRANGPDPPGLADYASQNNQLADAERVIGREEMFRLERARGDLRAAKELEVIDQCHQTIKELSEAAKIRTLAPEEDRRLKDAKADLIRAQEMIEVPDDAIQVDVLTHDTKTKTMARSKFYTKAEAPEHITQIQREQAAGYKSK